jgi:pimeloyl-ACP methyl ester carboxylesterase
MSSVNEGGLRVPGVGLYYRVRGTGPLLLILPGGHGDADAADDLCDQLLDRFTVVTYDRRGQSRSPLDAGARSPTIATHSGDAHQLLAALNPEPALVFGTSFGGLIGLDLVARHPEQVRLFVAHEPPTWELLPDAERNEAVRALEGIVVAFRDEGLIAAFQKLAELTAIDYADREPGVALARPSLRVAANLKFFFTHDAPAVNSFRLDLGALRAASTPIVPAIGLSKRSGAPHQCAAALAQTLGTSAVEFPGGHSGWLLRPKEFAAKLAEVLSHSGGRRSG